MPSGSTHDRITLWILAPIAILSSILTADARLTLIICAGFLFSGLMFGPDLDINSRQFKRWGKLKFIWLPYQKLLRHRSILSHGFTIGTILRVIYLLSFLIFISIFTVAIAQSIWGFYWNWREFILASIELLRGDYRNLAIAAFIGLELGALSHIISDTIVSAYKKSRKSKKLAQKKTPRNRRNK
ncbi:MAG: metal-binding protein [Prochloraceae cyanobacterium]